MDILILLVITVALILLVFRMMSAQSPIGHWKSEDGEAEYRRAYDLALKKMPSPTTTQDIDTSFGTVRIYKWENEQNTSKAPIVLFPGRASGTPMWSKNIADFLENRTVFALDALGDAGMSVQSKRIKNSQDQAQWIAEVFEKIGITKVHAIGHSFGGWLTANYASHYPENIASIILLEPVFTFQPIKLKIFLKSIPYSIPFFPQAWKQGLLHEIAGTKDIPTNDPVARMIMMGSNHYAAKLPVPSQISAEQMKQWNFPVYCDLGGKSSLHDSRQALQVAQKNVSQFEGKVWEDGTHSLPMEYSRKIGARIIDFLTSCGI